MKPNNQPVEKQFHHDRGMVDLHSIFHTIQGEGPFTGHRSIFVRLAGCNLMCPGCDTEYTQGRKKVMPEYVVKEVQKLPEVELIVLTGGEPFRQNILPLCQVLWDAGYNIQVETNGVRPIPSELAACSSSFGATKARFSVVVSPKTHVVHESIARIAIAYKYVLQAGNVDRDGLPIQALQNKVKRRVARPTRKDIPIYINPFDEKDDTKNRLNLDTTIRSCLQHGYTMGIQLHKFLNME